MRKFLTGILALFLLIGFVFAVDEDNGLLTITNEDKTLNAILTDTTVSGTFDLNNPDDVGDLNVTGITLAADDLVSGGNTIASSKVTFDEVTPFTLNEAITENIQFIIDVTGQPYFGVYNGDVTATDSSGVDCSTSNCSIFDYTLTIVQTNALTVTDLNSDDELFISGPADNEVHTNTFIITNTGNSDLTPTVTVSGDFTDNDDDTITFAAITVGTIVPAGTATVTVSADIDDSVDVDLYEGNVTVTTAYAEATATFPLKVRVEPDICEDGRVSDEDPVSGPQVGNIQIKIQEPDDEDNFEILREIEIEVNVENEDNNDMEVVVEASLWNMDQDNEIASVISTVEDIDEQDDRDFDLILTVPIDEDLEDQDDEYRLFVKAYEDGDEDQNCNYDSVEVELDLNRDDVVVESFNVNPSTAVCGDTISLDVSTTNIGRDKQDDVVIQVTSPLHPELKLDLQSLPLDLDKFGKTRDNKREFFTFTLPDELEEKVYRLQALVEFDNGRKTSDVLIGLLTVQDCKLVTADQVSLTLTQATFTASVGSVFGIPATLSNTGENTVTFTVEITPVGGWADSYSQDVTVGAGQSVTVYSYLTPKQGITDGSYTATLNVMSNNEVLSTTTAVVTIGETTIAEVTTGAVYQPTITLRSAWRDLTNNIPVLVVLTVVVLGAVVYLGSILLRPK